MGGAATGGVVAGGTATGGTACAGAPVGPGWAMSKMPNPPSTGLPNPASYTVVGDGTVRDNVTGLVWQRDVPSAGYNWRQAKDYCSHLTLPGCGWRLPTRIELVSLVDFTKPSPGPTIDTNAFPGTPGDAFWSSSPLASAPYLAWIVYFHGGSVAPFDVTFSHRVRCVR